MPERDHDPEPAPWVDPSGRDDPEPAWATKIRARRKARADRLRGVFDAFDGKLSKEPGSPPEGSG